MAAPKKVQPVRKAKAAPRLPARARGIHRYGLLLDATDALLAECHVDDIGLYAIAERASVPPASVYHFFPTIDAAFYALAQRYLQAFLELFAQPVEPEAFSSWLGLLARDQKMSADFFNQHPAAMKLFLGRYGGEETRKADLDFNRASGLGIWKRLRFAFQMPMIADPARKFTNMLSMQDALWASSFAEFQYITDEYVEEAHRVRDAYLRLYFPEVIKLRPDIAAHVAAGDMIRFEPRAIVPRD